MNTDTPTAQKPNVPRTDIGTYSYPTVRWSGFPTAHPSTEAWAAAVHSDARDQGSRRHAVRRLRSVSHRQSSDEQKSARFAELQTRMAAVELASRAGEARTFVVVPSRTIDDWQQSAAKMQVFEERLLCTLLELRDPNVRITYVTSGPIASPIIDYYLSLLPPRLRRHARERVTLVALGEHDARPLSAKLLDQPDMLRRLRRTCGAAAACHLVPYNTTCLERDLALALDIPMYGADPRLAHLGTKSGCRELFAQAGVPHPLGVEAISSTAEAIEAIARLRGAKPELSRVVLKCNEGVSGEGNAILDLTHLDPPGAPDEPELIGRRLRSIAPEAPGVTSDQFLTRFSEHGGIVEEWISASEIQSPSVQLQVTPLGDVRLLSTHDQILGGPNGQHYLGCRFPAAPSYAPAISVLGRRVGERLADVGVIGRFAIDFVVARGEDGRWRPFAIELNLRKGGTTHPYETLASLTGGSYEADDASFVTPTGETKYYVATDSVESPELHALGTRGVLAQARRHGVRFDPMKRTGAVFHMLSGVNELGRCGFTAIANCVESADELYRTVSASLIDEAERCASSRRAGGRGMPAPSRRQPAIVGRAA
jgi:PGM1 C-terminal domain